MTEGIEKSQAVFGCFKTSIENFFTTIEYSGNGDVPFSEKREA